MLREPLKPRTEVHPSKWRRVVDADAFWEGGVWHISRSPFSPRVWNLGFDDQFGNMSGLWKLPTLAAAKRAAERASDFLAACWVVSHRLELAVNPDFWVKSVTGARNRVVLEEDGSIRVQQIIDGDGPDFYPEFYICWVLQEEEAPAFDSYPNAGAFLEGVFGREYFLAATDRQVFEIADGLWGDWEGSFRSCLKTAARVAGVD